MVACSRPADASFPEQTVWQVAELRYDSQMITHLTSITTLLKKGAQKITNLGKLPSEQKRKTPKQQKKIKIIKENSQVKRENSQALRL